MMQHQSEAKSLEAPWRVTGMNYIERLKTLESDVHGYSSSNIHFLFKSPELFACAGWLSLFFHSYSLQAPSLFDGAAHIQGGCFSFS
jgi:hypothetical protein